MGARTLCFFVNDGTQRGVHNYFITLLLSDKQAGGEVIADYPLYTCDVMQITEPSQQTPRRQVRDFRLPFASALTDAPAYVSVYICIHVYAHSQRRESPLFCVTCVFVCSQHKSRELSWGEVRNAVPRSLFINYCSDRGMIALHCNCRNYILLRN